MDASSLFFIAGGALGLMLLRDAKNRHFRRANHLVLAERALATHYDAMAKVVDDPALPYGALQLLSSFSDGIADRDTCRLMTEILSAPDPQSQGPLPHWFNELRDLQVTRPDIVDNFFAALQSGFVAAFLRWPENEAAHERLLDTLLRGKRREAELAERVFLAQRERMAHVTTTATA